MTWYYAIGSERKGPVTEAELDQLAAQGELRSDTLVWRDGMADWKPLAEVRPTAATSQPPLLATATTPLGDADTVRNEHLKHEASIQSVGFLYYLGGGAIVLASVALLIGGVATASNSAESGVGMIVGGGLFGFLGAVQLWTAHGLRRLKPSARIPATLLSCLGLLGFPIGTLINGYILYLLHSKQGRTVMTADYAQVIAQTPHIKYKTSIILWIFLGLIITLLVLGIIGHFTTRR